MLFKILMVCAISTKACGRMSWTNDLPKLAA